MPSEDDWQQVPAMPQSCNAAPRTQSTVAGAKRMRRLTAKALALDSSLADELEYSMAGKVDMAMQQVQLQGEQVCLTTGYGCTLLCCMACLWMSCRNIVFKGHGRTSIVAQLPAQMPFGKQSVMPNLLPALPCLCCTELWHLCS